MVIILIIIEIISYILRAFSLAIRLSANIIAGHTLLHIISDLKIGILKLLFGISPIVLLLLLLIFFLEIGVAFVQSYVFLMLTCLYLHDSIEGGAH
jgi:ATP synthase subunit 6